MIWLGFFLMVLVLYSPIFGPLAYRIMQQSQFGFRLPFPQPIFLIINVILSSFDGVWTLLLYSVLGWAAAAAILWLIEILLGSILYGGDPVPETGRPFDLLHALGLRNGMLYSAEPRFSMMLARRIAALVDILFVLFVLRGVLTVLVTLPFFLALAADAPLVLIVMRLLSFLNLVPGLEWTPFGFMLAILTRTAYRLFKRERQARYDREVNEVLFNRRQELRARFELD